MSILKFYVFCIIILSLIIFQPHLYSSNQYMSDETEKNTDSKFLSLPTEIKVMIFDYLDGRSFKNIKLTCNEFYNLSQTPTLLFPEDNVEKIKLLLLNSFNRALILVERMPPKSVAQKLIIFSEKTKKDNNHYIFGSLKNHQLSNLSWDICYKSLYLAQHIGDSDAQRLLTEECIRKENRLSNYKNYLRDNDDDDVTNFFCWEQVAYFNIESRNNLIKFYQSTTNKTFLEKAENWTKFDWKINSFSMISNGNYI